VKAPKAPDPYATAQAQAAANIQASTAQAAMNMVDQINPYGTLSYTQRGTTNVGGQVVPQYTATTVLSPEQQHLLDQTTQADTKTNDIGLAQIDKIGTLLGSPIDLNTAAEGKIGDLQRQRLDPMWDKKGADLEQELMNRGIRPGSEAYATLHDQYAHDRNDAYNSMYLNARQEGVSEAIQERQQPINEVEALLNGQQMTNPSWVQTPQETVQAPDIAGMIYKNYQDKSQNYQSALGGLFGLGSALIGGGARIFSGSDRRIKKDIVAVAEHPSGLTVYRYTYVWGDEPEYGLIAQEVQARRPHAVSDQLGFLCVDYAAALA